MRFLKLSLLLPVFAAKLLVAAPDDFRHQHSLGAAFALTNRTENNEVIAFARTSDGQLIETGRYSTRGNGLGSDFDSQGGLILSADHRFLYACNPGSDDITVFAVQGSALIFLRKVPAGDEPLSITISGNLMYVLDGSVAATQITGFRIGPNGVPRPLPNSTKSLSSPIAVPGEVLFSPDGKKLVVTHKVNGVTGPQLDTFLIDSAGLPSDPIVSAATGMRPFAEAFRSDGTLFVIESGLPVTENAGVSSYQLNNDGTLESITNSAKNGQTDGCWIVITNDQHYAFASNFASATISSYELAKDGRVSLINGAAASEETGSESVDLALSSDGHYLYNLLRGPGAIAVFRVEQMGQLIPIGVFGKGGGLPANYGVSGLAVY